MPKNSYESIESTPAPRVALFLFLSGCLAGAVFFCLTYGIEVIDFTYDGWIFAIKDPDIQQHYIGWCCYRRAAWQFPPGLMDNLSWPFSMSILWTDSIPLLAIFFKLLSPLLPGTFQYLGFYGMVCAALNGGFGSLLSFRVSGRKSLGLIAAVFFSMPFTVIQRMFYHTTLTAQWIITAALLLWFEDSWRWQRRRKRLHSPGQGQIQIQGLLPPPGQLSWLLLFFTAVTIHPYLWAMAAIIWLFSLAERFLTMKADARGFASLFLELLPASAVTASGLYLVGALNGPVNASYRLGGFESNLNSLFNPLRYGRLLPQLPLAHRFQYEGYGYLGAGMLFFMALVFTALPAVYLKSRCGCPGISGQSGQTEPSGKSGPSEPSGPSMPSGQSEPSAPSEPSRPPVQAEPSGQSARSGGGILSEGMARPLLFAIMVLCVWIWCSIPQISFNDQVIAVFPIPARLQEILGIFRSNGRFIWIVDICLMAAAFAAAGYLSRALPGARGRIFISLLSAAAIALQLIDMSDTLSDIRARSGIREETEYSDLDNELLTAHIDRYSHIIMAYDDILDSMHFAFFASRYGLTLNRFYFARNIDGQAEEELNGHIQRLKAGSPSPDCIYLVDDSQIEEWRTYPLYFYDMDGTWVGVSEPLE